jgi:hypothetical protein
MCRIAATHLLLLLFHQYVNELFDGLLAKAALKTAISNLYSCIHQRKYSVHNQFVHSPLAPD